MPASSRRGLLTNSMSKMILISEENFTAFGCFNLEGAYTNMVIKDLIDKAVEEQA